MVMSNVLRRVRRSGPNPVLKEWGAEWPFWNTRSVSGATVTDDSALSLTAFYRGVSLIAGTLASMPLQVFQEDIDADGNEGETRKIKTKDTAYLWRRPNPEDTMQEFWERIFGDLVRGNAFIWVEKNSRGGIAAIWYVERTRVRVGRTTNGQKVYEIDDELPMIDYSAGGEIVHIKNWGRGLIGYDPVKIGKEAIALGLSAQEYAARFYTNDGVPPGVLTSEQPLSPEESDRIAERWQKRQAGTRNARKIAVLGHGAKYESIQANLEEAQVLESRRYSVQDCARLTGLPPHLLADVERSTSWGSGIEEQNRNLMVFTLAAHTRRAELGVTDSLLVRELTNRYARFNVAALLRGTTLQQYQAFALGYGRWLTPNDIRAALEMAPIEGGDVLPTASNLIPIEDLGSNFREAPPPRESE